MYAEIGPVSEGTLKEEDLIIRFLEVYKDLVGEGSDDWEYISNRPHDDWLLSDIMDALNEHAPPYCYFGANESDGACFGFWPDIEALREINHVSDPAELDTLRADEALYVNDHGNMTLYARDGWREVWSVV